MPISDLDQTILKAIPIPAFVVDNEVRIVDMNSAAARLCAQDREVFTNAGEEKPFDAPIQLTSRMDVGVHRFASSALSAIP